MYTSRSGIYSATGATPAEARKKLVARIEATGEIVDNYGNPVV